MIHAAGRGTTLALIATPEADATRTGDDVVAGAITLKAALADLKVLTPSESHLLGDWLDRIIDGHAPVREI